MTQMTTLLAQPLGLSAIWQRVLLEANPKAGDVAALDAQGLTLVFPEGYDPASIYHRISVARTGVKLLVLAALGVHGQREALARDGYPDAALVGFDKLANLLAGYVARKLLDGRVSDAGITIVYQDISLKRHVEAAATIADLIPVLEGCARETGPDVLAVYATSLDVPDLVMPSADAAILVPANALTLRGQETIFSGTGDGLTPLCHGRLPDELNILEPSISSLREAYAGGTTKDVEYSATRLLAAMTDVLARAPDVSPVAWGWIYALSEAATMVAMERGFVMKTGFFSAHTAFAAVAAPTIRFE